MIDLEQINSISTDELSSIQSKITKELDKRSGLSLDIKKLRAQVYKLAKSLGCEWLPESLPGELLVEDALPKKRGRKPKIDVSAQTVAGGENKVEEAALRVGVDGEKRKLSWAL